MVENGNKPENFKDPVASPQSNEEAQKWQKANKNWWEGNPMRYDWKKNLGYKEFSKEFFEEIDRRFFSNAKEYLSKTEVPFDEFLNFKNLKDKDTLEIGVGNGSHAGIIAPRAKSFTGIDLTEYAVKSVSERLKHYNFPVKILRMDAEKLEFPDDSFDLVWSWGVIHHSSDTSKIIQEIYRVLRPGGKAVIMVYHRGWWNYYVEEILYGLVSGNLLKTKSLHRSVQLHTDGALARYYSFSEWKKAVDDLFKVEWIQSLGPKTDVLPLPSGKLRNFLSKLLSNNLNRFLTKNCRMGSFLVSGLKKNG